MDGMLPRVAGAQYDASGSDAQVDMGGSSAGARIQPVPIPQCLWCNPGVAAHRRDRHHRPVAFGYPLDQPVEISPRWGLPPSPGRQWTEPVRIGLAGNAP